MGRGGWEVKGGGEGRMGGEGRRGEVKGGGEEVKGEGKGEERMRQEGRGLANIHIHPPFQSGPLLILVGWYSLSSSPSPPNNIGQEQLTTGRHTYLNEYNIPFS